MVDSLTDAVLNLVDRIPPGRVMTYGLIAECLGRGGARQVGTIMARRGGGVPWHRVVAANGRITPGLEEQALELLRTEGTPMRGSRVDVPGAVWWPERPLSEDPPGPQPD